MRFVFAFLVIIAVILSALIIGLAIFAMLDGSGSVILPGLGLIISPWSIVLLLAAIDCVIILFRLSCEVNEP